MTHKHLPKDWQIKKLGEVCFYSKGKKPKMLTGEKTGNAKLPYINIKAFEKGVFDEYTDGYKCNLCEDNEILMVWDGARAGFVGKAKKGAIGSTLMKISPKENIDKDYIFYYLKSIFKKINTNPRGVGIPHVEPNLLWNSEINIPNLPTQQSIVARIEQLFSELDQAVANLKTAQAQLKTYRQSVLKWAFEGRLTREDVQEGVLPEGWENKTIDDVIEISKEKFKPDNLESKFYVGLEHIEKNLGKLNSECGFEDIRTLKNKFNKGDILYGKLRPNLNKVYLAKEDGVCSTDILVFRTKNNCNAKFLSQILLGSDFVNSMSENTTGVNLPRVSTKFILEYSINLPSITEQHTIVQAIETRLSVADQLEENIKAALQKAEILRQSILKKAFSGEWE